MVGGMVGGMDGGRGGGFGMSARRRGGRPAGLRMCLHSAEAYALVHV
jgi:hypothetical protein